MHLRPSNIGHLAAEAAGLMHSSERRLPLLFRRIGELRSTRLGGPDRRRSERSHARGDWLDFALAKSQKAHHARYLPQVLLHEHVHRIAKLGNRTEHAYINSLVQAATGDCHASALSKAVHQGAIRRTCEPCNHSVEGLIHLGPRRSIRAHQRSMPTSNPRSAHRTVDAHLSRFRPLVLCRRRLSARGTRSSYRGPQTFTLRDLRACANYLHCASLDHLISLVSSPGGTVMPSILAVWLLITGSNLFDCRKAGPQVSFR